MAIPTIRAVDHVAMTVPDLEAGIRFFVDVVGGEHVYTTGVFDDPTGDWMATNINVDARARLRIAMVRLGSTTTLELFEYEAPDQRTQIPRNSDLGASHLCFYVDDMDAAVAYLKTVEGVRVLGEPTPVGAGQPNHGATFVYWLSPWGHQLELISVPDGYDYETTTDARLAPTPAAWDNRKKEK